jgi:hypothetical protein
MRSGSKEDPMEWMEFQNRFLQLVSEEYRFKTIAALKQIVPNLPAAATPDNLYLFIPGPHDGCVFEVHQHHYFMYLAPFLELLTQEEVVFTVAHEFAHVFRRVTGTNLSSGPEEEGFVDALAESWGFENVEFLSGHWLPKRKAEVANV